MSWQENPYQSPESMVPFVLAGGHRHIDGFESGHVRAVWTSTLLAILIPLHMLSVGTDLLTIRSWYQAQRGVVASDSEVIMIDVAATSISVLGFVVWLASLIAFLMWIHRACRNLSWLGTRDLWFSPGWAVGCFFVPIANFYVPYQAVKEIWQNSDPGRFPARDGLLGSVKPASIAVVRWWWAFEVVSMVFGLMFLKLGTDTQDAILLSNWTDLYGNVADVLKNSLAILIVWRVDKYQEERHALVLRASETAIAQSIAEGFSHPS